MDRNHVGEELPTVSVLVVLGEPSTALVATVEAGSATAVAEAVAEVVVLVLPLPDHCPGCPPYSQP